MPELPEVETIVRQLNVTVKGKVISQVKIRDYAKNIEGNLVQKALAQIEGVKRRAKLLIFELANGYTFIIHLKLTGQLLYYPKLPDEIPPSNHVIFSFKDGSVLLFNDFRKFGFIKLIETKKFDDFMAKQKFGPEPLTLSLAEFRSLLAKKPKAKIKPLLMDQSFIAGLGNIYAQEACYQAGILPTKKVGALDVEEVKKLYQAILEILKSAIAHKGTSFDTIYVTPDNKPGDFETYLKVYHQDQCSKCHSNLKRIDLGGRGTYYCSVCQK